MSNIKGIKPQTFFPPIYNYALSKGKLGTTACHFVPLYIVQTADNLGSFLYYIMYISLIPLCVKTVSVKAYIIGMLLCTCPMSCNDVY